MLDQLQVTTLPILTLPSPSVSSYAIGPLDPIHLITLPISLSTGEVCHLLLPSQLPPSLVAHPVFLDGCQCGYQEGQLQEEDWTVPKLLNELYHDLEDLWRAQQESDGLLWAFGLWLGMLTDMAEWDKTLALTALAHLCFLLPPFIQPRPADWPRYEPYYSGYRHTDAVKAYRVLVRIYREQGKSFEQAQRLALAGNQVQDRQRERKQV